MDTQWTDFMVPVGLHPGLIVTGTARNLFPLFHCKIRSKMVTFWVKINFFLFFKNMFGVRCWWFNAFLGPCKCPNISTNSIVSEYGVISGNRVKTTPDECQHAWKKSKTSTQRGPCVLTSIPMIPIDEACVIFHEKVVFWPISGAATPSKWLILIKAHMQPPPSCWVKCFANEKFSS